MQKKIISVDYEWAYQEVVNSHDFHDATSGWVDAFVEGWCDGFLEGYIKGALEGTVRIINAMKCKGISAKKIEECIGVSPETINMIGTSEND